METGITFMAWTDVGFAEYIVVPLDHRAPAYRWIHSTIPLQARERPKRELRGPKPQIDLEANTRLDAERARSMTNPLL